MNDTIYTDSGGEFVSQMMRDGCRYEEIDI